MKRLRLPICLILLTAVLSSTALAGDFSQLNFIGFSKDGKYLAFEEYGIGSSDEAGVSSIYFVNTLKNEYAAPPVFFRAADSFEETYDYSSDSAARRQTRLSAASALKKYGIIPGNTGDQVIARLLNDVTDENTSIYEPKSVTFTPNRREAWLNGRFELSLKTVARDEFCKASEDLELVRYVGLFDLPFPKISVSPNRRTSNNDRQKLYSFELSLKNDDTDQTRILQKALAVPPNRGCAIDYRIHSVYLYKNHIAVFIGIVTPGFIGDNIRLMVVTGELADQNDQ
jgi:predicted secreted protein